MTSFVPKVPMPEFPIVKIGQTIASVHYELVRIQDELVRSMVRIYPNLNHCP